MARGNRPRHPGRGLIKAGASRSLVNVGNGERSGFLGPFFNPGRPLPPIAQSSEGRAFDFPTGLNLNYQPRSQQGVPNIPFPVLRRLADPAQGGLDLLRLAIEKRKTEMKVQDFHIVARDGTDGGEAAKAAMQMLRKPDGFTRWRQWLGMLLEDHFVIDAPSIYFRPDRDRVLLEIVDGATIDLLIDDRGRTPMPPLPAYQQIIKGLPASDYTVNEMGYYVDNPRPGRIYGMGIVEQLATIITIALNRQLSVLNYFTAGSVPDMLIGVPETWNPSQIAEFQQYWDSVLAGQLDKRRQAQFVPGASKPYESKGDLLKNQFDEWLARIICFCMGISPESLVAQTNRATAETAKESAKEDGLESTKAFVKEVIDDILERLGAPDLELQWLDEEIIDAKTKAEVTSILTGGKTLMTVDEGREMAGLKPATPAQKAELDAANAPPPDPFADPFGGNDNGPDDDEPDSPEVSADTPAKVAKRRGRSLHPVPANRKGARRVGKAITALAKKALQAQKKAVLAKLATLSKATSDEIAGLLAELRRTPWDEAITGKLRELLQDWTQARTTATLDALANVIGGSDSAFTQLLTQANEQAVEYAREKVGNLVRGIDDASQQFLNELTSTAIETGLTNDELASLISDSYGFSDERATVIARTETAIADEAGKMIGYRESGVVTGKGWDPDADPCPICQANADQGVIPLDDVFSSGDDHAPAHPNCECSTYPVVDDSEGQ